MLKSIKEIIYIHDDRYLVLATVSVDSGYSPDDIKNMYGLADTVLRNNDYYYACHKLIDVEFEEIKQET